MYGVDGHAVPAEVLLDNLNLYGYRGSRPVRIGNGAASQTQREAEGYTLDAVVLCLERLPRPVRPELWNLLRQLADRAARGWRESDHGPWEMRGEPRHFLYSKLYCWVALDRALRLAEATGLEGNLELWRRERQQARDAIIAHGFCEEVGAFPNRLAAPLWMRAS